MIQSMVWPWLAQAARAWGSDTPRVPCRRELPGDPAVMVLAVPAVTMVVAAQVVVAQVAATQAGAAVPVAEAEAVEMAAEAEAAVDSLHRARKRNRQKGLCEALFY